MADFADHPPPGGHRDAPATGLLEHPALLLLPWASGPRRPGRGPSPQGRTRPILDPDTGALLGFVSPRPGAPTGLLRWFTREALEVREADDEPLLFTLFCPWLLTRTWDVQDAEEHPVGGLRGNRVQDRFGRVLAVVDGDGAGSFFRFRSARGWELGTLAREPAGSRLSFARVLAGDPFAKMLLLAGALALTNPRRAGPGARGT